MPLTVRSKTQASGGRINTSQPVHEWLVATTLAFTLAMDSIKLPVFARVRID